MLGNQSLITKLSEDVSPTAKAKEIIEGILSNQGSAKFYPTDKKCALMLVDYVYNAIAWDNVLTPSYKHIDSLNYWVKVKAEIENYKQ